MRQGITTRYLGPTNSRGPRIKAIARKRSSFGAELSLTEPLPYTASFEKDHARVAKRLAAKLGRAGLWVAGDKPEEDGYMYVNLGVPLAEKVDSLPEHISFIDQFGQEDRDWFYVSRPA